MFHNNLFYLGFGTAQVASMKTVQLLIQTNVFVANYHAYLQITMSHGNVKVDFVIQLTQLQTGQRLNHTDVTHANRSIQMRRKSLIINKDIHFKNATPAINRIYNQIKLNVTTVKIKIKQKFVESVRRNLNRSILLIHFAPLV